MSQVRVRFAPSPTGGLHLGGVRTALFNYLFARQHNGKFVLRVEDTDQTRFVPGAEEYIYACLSWCGISPDESTSHPGGYGPYKQSERKGIYAEYAERLVKAGKAYYAFDTPDEIENLREILKKEGKDNLQYGHQSRMQMRNSLTMPESEVHQLIQDGTPYVVRLKVNAGELIRFHDLIRGDIEMSTDTVDDKILLKADGMPTYHLAVVVDDHLMKITHAFRGEEWLPSAPVHILLYEYLGWKDEMPKWAHLPLILKPDGNGKLSKRDGERLGFPVFAMEWNDPVKGKTEGFRELGFLPQAFINMLAMLGWNDGTGQEIFTLKELVEKFEIERVHVHGAKFDYEKARWFNQEWIKKLSAGELYSYVNPIFKDQGFDISDLQKTESIISLVKDRCVLLTDFIKQSSFFFVTPSMDEDIIKDKWNETKDRFFRQLVEIWQSLEEWKHDELEKTFKELMSSVRLKAGEVMAPFRVMLVGGKYGPGVFDIATLIGKDETIRRIRRITDRA